MTVPVNAELGDILKFVEIVSIIGTGFVVVYRMGGAIQQFKMELATMQKTLDRLVVAQEEQIKNTVRLDSTISLVAEMRKELNGLRGIREGLIRDAIDGEYRR